MLVLTWCCSALRRESLTSYPGRRVDYFTVVCSVTWPLNGCEARGDRVLIQTSLLLLCKSSCCNASWVHLHDKSSEVCNQSKVTCRPGHWADNCKMVYFPPVVSNLIKMSVLVKPDFILWLIFERIAVWRDSYRLVFSLCLLAFGFQRNRRVTDSSAIQCCNWDVDTA